MKIEASIETLKTKRLFLATPCYGGMTTGIYTRAVSDLTGLCAKYGIHLVEFLLFNESLITRARNYCCLDGSNKIHTEDGLMTIRKIVDTKYSGKVLSCDSEGNFGWNKVINHWVKSNTNKKPWVSLKGDFVRLPTPIVTDDHPIAVIRNIFDPVIEYVEAKDSNNLHMVRRVNKSVSNTRYTQNALFNKNQISALVGTILGDGYISKTGTVQINHSEKQYEYIEEKRRLFNGTKLRDTVKKIENIEKYSSYRRTEYFGHALCIGINAQTKKLRKLMYNGKKTVKNIVGMIDDISLAFWYMDDGFYHNGISNGAKPTMQICTHGYSYDDHLILKDMFKEKFGIDCVICGHKENEYFLRFIHSESIKFWNVVAKYIHPSMRYKLPEEYKNVEYISLSNTSLGYAAAHIAKVDYLWDRPYGHTRFNSRLYDIEVENNHNFVANDTLVHNCDEFLRSDCTHMLFIDSDIGFDANDVIAMLILQDDASEYDILAAPYPKKSVSSKAKILTEDGVKTIKWITDNKYSGKVLSLRDDGKFEWNRVLAHHVSPYNTNKKWVRIGRNGKKNLICTDDHEVYVIDNPLNLDRIYKIEARNSVGKYIIRNPVNDGKNSVNALYNREQMSALIGTLIGDGNIRKGYLSFSHSHKQKEYLYLKKELFGGRIRGPVKSGSYTNLEKAHIEYFAYHMNCPRNAQILELEKLFYPNGEKKTIRNVLPMLDEMGLAFWYMDDGCLTNSWVRFCSESFSFEEHEMIKSHFKNKFDIDIYVNKHDGKNRFSIPAQHRNKFFSLISKYVPIHMEYKLPPEFRGKDKHVFNTQRLDYSVEYIKEVVPAKKTYRRQYDITVEHNHNFISDGYVISNCIAWEKIVAAVNAGMGDKNPEDLSKFMGDFVFNPKEGGQAIRLDEPAQVLEAGTGFMMIRRKTFEIFREKYPQYMYKPDHVRTQHFDGTREIMQFFQAEIDPKSKRYLSEDYWFNQKCWDIGLKTWLCPWMRTQHAGTQLFGGSLADLASINQHATADVSLLKKDKK